MNRLSCVFFHSVSKITCSGWPNWGSGRKKRKKDVLSTRSTVQKHKRGMTSFSPKVVLLMHDVVCCEWNVWLGKLSPGLPTHYHCFSVWDHDKVRCVHTWEASHGQFNSVYATFSCLMLQETVGEETTDCPKLWRGWGWIECWRVTGAGTAHAWWYCSTSNPSVLWKAWWCWHCCWRQKMQMRIYHPPADFSSWVPTQQEETWAIVGDTKTFPRHCFSLLQCDVMSYTCEIKSRQVLSSWKTQNTKNV